MNTKNLKLKIILPEGVIFDEFVKEVTLPTESGVITVLPRHIPIVAKLKSGEIVGRNEGESIPFAVFGGFVEVRKNGDDTEVNVLADFAEHVSNLTEDEIAKSKARALELMEQKNNKEVVDFEHFEAELERSLNRIKISDKWRNRKYRI